MPNPNLERGLSEIDLKCLYLERMRGLGLIDGNSVIASEYSLGRTGRRADLAILCKEFIGIEFKSKYDSLKRLKQQLDAYVQCFDRVVLVVDERHLNNAQSLLPSCVELWSVGEDGHISLAKMAEMGGGFQAAQVLAQLCTIRHLRKLAALDYPSSNVSRSKLNDAVLKLPIDTIYDAAISTFKSAFARSSAAFWGDLDPEKKIDRKALGPLSRFADARKKQTLALQRQSDFWLAWTEEAAAILGSAAN